MKKNHVLIGVWIAATTLIMSTIMSQHVAPFVHPAHLESTARSLASVGQAGSQAKVSAVHILDPRCSCSMRVLDYLTNQKDSSVRHITLLLSPPSAEIKAALEKSEVLVRQTSPEEAKEQFRLESVPWFVVLNSDLEILYSGGYASGPIRTEKDLRLNEILTTAKVGTASDKLPSYGCVTSEKLRKELMFF